MDGKPQSHDEGIWNNQADRVETLSTPLASDVSSLAHPIWLIIAPLVGIAALMDAMNYMKSVRDVQVTIVTGLAVGLPLILIWKWHYRRCKDYYVEYYTTSYWVRNSWKNGKTNLACFTLVMLALTATRILAGRMQLPDFSIYSILCILCILIYPEQKAIWLAAKARVAAMEEDAEA